MSKIYRIRVTTRDKKDPKALLDQSTVTLRVPKNTDVDIDLSEAQLGTASEVDRVVDPGESAQLEQALDNAGLSDKAVPSSNDSTTASREPASVEEQVRKAVAIMEYLDRGVRVGWRYVRPVVTYLWNAAMS